MASEFQAQVFENGRWVMRDMNVHDVLNKPATKPAKQNKPPPQCGIMTRTLVESPVAHWILPVRLRSPQHNDIAIVGDHYVQISELQDDLQLHSIVKKKDFGSRIRNAKVIGTFNRDDIDASRFQASRSHPRQADDDMDLGISEISTPGSSPNPPQLPPQLLLIILETGDCIFLFLRPGRDGSFEFAALQHELDATRLVRPGFHLAVDPSSRYVAQACSRDIFVVHELESMSNLNNSFTHGHPLRPVKSSRPRAVNGTIHTMDFLYPRPQDPHHIILLLIVVNRGVPRMITYDWELGDDVGEALAAEKTGHLLPRNHEMPLLIIPLTIRTAFFAVSEGEIAFCKDILYGSPTFEPCEIGDFPPSEHHDGDEPPLWTAWSRPPRLSRFHPKNDHIYVAREDGLVLFLECDSENILGAAFNHGTFCNVSTAFTSLSHHNDDILVFGGDSGLGGVWKAPPREQVVRLSQIPNWSPTVDFVTTNESRRWDDYTGATGKNGAVPEEDVGVLSSGFSKPDRIFAAAGRGRNGSIVEYRHGLRANIGIDFDLGTVVKRCFMLPANVAEPDYGHHLLLSLPGRSALLRFDPDFSTTYDVDPEESLYDISSPTLTARRVSEELIVQVTENGIVLMNSSTSKQVPFVSLGLVGAVVTDATIQGNMLAVTSHAENVFELHTILLDGSNLAAHHLHRETFEGEVTCLGLCSIGGRAHAVASLWRNNAVYLDLYSVEDKAHVKTIPMQSIAESVSQDDTTRGMANTIEPFTSIVPVLDVPGNSVLIAGSRDGLLVTLNLGNGCEVASVSLERVGAVPAYVYEAFDGSAFVCCDASFTLIGDYQGGARGFAKKQSIWTVDANDSSKLAPSITSVVVLQESLSGSAANTPLLLLAMDHVLLAELQPEVGPVQRQMPLGMTPHKLLYSHILKCLVVGARTLDDRPTLKFIDPDTGDDLSLPLHGHAREPAEFISGLGKPGDRILCLEEWHIESKNKNFYFIVVATAGGPADGGRVLIVSPQVERPANGDSRGRISFFTRHRIKGPKEPVYAVATAGHKIQAAFHSELVYYKLNDIEKRLEQISTTQLDSEAWKLSVLPNSPHTLALTKRDSLWVLEQVENERDGFEVRHVDPYTPHGLDMLEVAGAWPPPPQSAQSPEPPPSIVLMTDQECGLNGLWIPWDSPDRDCEVLFETDLPSTVRRLRLGRTLPSWSRSARGRHGNKRFGLLAASANDGEVLGMGIDGSLQHFTLLDPGAWRFLRFLQNVSETSAELYPFTYMQFESAEDEEAFDPRPLSPSASASNTRETLERQVDGDLMQRILDRRVLERLVWSRGEWVEYFMEYLDGVDGGRWTASFQGLVSEEERGRAYLRLAYEVLEYFLVPVI